MIKGTRFFSRRLLPLLLAAVMLLGMLPALTLPVLAEDPPALTNVAQGKTYPFTARPVARTVQPVG